MPTGPKIAAITLVVILAAAGLYYAFVAPSTPAPSRAGVGASEPATAAPSPANGIGSQSPGTIPSVGAAPSPATSTPAIGALTGTPAPTGGLGTGGLNGLPPRGEQPGFTPGSLGAADPGKGDLPATARPALGGNAGGSLNGLPAGGLNARPIGPTQPSTPAAVTTPALGGNPGMAPSSPAPAPASGGPRPVAPERPTTVGSTGGASSTEQIHVVASGDTMSGIAKRYLGKESAWNAIAKANPNVDPTAMKVGTRLRIPAADGTSSAAGTGSTAGSTASNSASGSSSSPSSASSGSSHTVAAGDTLSSISRKHYGDGKYWEKIYEANKSSIGSDPARLRVGQRLTLPKIDGASAR
ncbi:MAG: LysM peptidoglycan-binding domain-containing protein [Phycisphaera sp.]|nr:LysM peptidoglycan-binding domain-containing protein [Phycisphaera sp.]